jgi:polar amino acid transport system substrate-binding protein
MFRLLLSTAFLLFLTCSCGDDQDNTTQSQATQAPIHTPSEAPKSDKELVVAFTLNNIPPFVFEDRGIEIDLFEEALKSYGYSIKPLYLSYARLQVAMEQQDIDIVATVPQDFEDERYHFVDQTIYFENYVITKAQDKLSVENLSELSKISIATWQNAHQALGPEFEKIFRPDGDFFDKSYYEIPSQQDQCRMFWAGRVQSLIIDKAIFLWYQKNLRDEFDTSKKVTYHDLFPGRTYYKSMFRSKEIRTLFNDAFLKMKADGRYQAIWDRYK